LECHERNRRVVRPYDVVAGIEGEETPNLPEEEEEQMKRLMVLFLLFVLAGSLLAQAQAPAGPPKPGPEHKRLAAFVGKWTSEGEMKENPFGPAGKFTFSENCYWFSGRFHVVCNSDVQGSIMGYDPEEKVYTYYEINSMGEAELSKGTVDGKVWTWTNEARMGGKPTKSRFTLTQESADSQSYKFEMSVGNGPMQMIMEGKSTRVPGPAKK
jgi:hypothetical protein